jgi:CheY-like chemotaxis protein
VRILLVDPQPDSRSVIANWVHEFFGRVSIEPVSSGAEALRAIDQRCPDLVLAVHPLPALDGIELTAIIKARPNPPLIVVITAGCAAGLDLHCRAAGVDLLLEKRHLQSRLLAFLQARFPKVWAEGVVTRSLASLHERHVKRERRLTAASGSSRAPRRSSAG